MPNESLTVVYILVHVVQHSTKYNTVRSTMLSDCCLYHCITLLYSTVLYSTVLSDCCLYRCINYPKAIPAARSSGGGECLHPRHSHLASSAAILTQTLSRKTVPRLSPSESDICSLFGNAFLIPGCGCHRKAL